MVEDYLQTGAHKVKYTKEDCLRDVRSIAFGEKEPCLEEGLVRWFFFETTPGYWFLLLISAIIRILEACEVH